jgi:RHS repeat-associated protein
MRFGNAQELTHRYLYGPEVDQVLADEVFAAGAGGQRISSDVLWQLADQQGSIRDVVDAAGTVRNHVEYDAYGNITSEGVSVAQGAGGGASVTAVDQLFYYTGQELDKDAKLYNYNARWYDPAMGRFISEDPSGFDAGDPNLYRYVGDDPISNTDPTGLQQRTPIQALNSVGILGAVALAPGTWVWD